MTPSEAFLRDSMREIRKDRIAFVFYPEQTREIQKRCVEERIDIAINEGKNFAKAIFKKNKEELE